MKGDFVYMVTFDGYFGSYGTENYLLGIFLTQKKAEEATAKFKEFAKANLEDPSWLDKMVSIKSVPFNEALPLVYNNRFYELIETPIYLGGYIE